jgi:hypothetical protein
MQRSGIRGGQAIPDFTAFHPGYVHILADA